jgi:hypothetical protein
MQTNESADAAVVDAFVAHLAEQRYPGIQVESRPDVENRNSSDIDAIAGPFAIEHTSVDTVEHQRRNSACRGSRQKNSPFKKMEDLRETHTAYAVRTCDCAMGESTWGHCRGGSEQGRCRNRWRRGWSILRRLSRVSRPMVRESPRSKH